jgi:hypothetical protein
VSVTELAVTPADSSARSELRVSVRNDSSGERDVILSVDLALDAQSYERLDERPTISGGQVILHSGRESQDVTTLLRIPGRTTANLVWRYETGVNLSPRADGSGWQPPSDRNTATATISSSGIEATLTQRFSLGAGGCDAVAPGPFEAEQVSGPRDNPISTNSLRVTTDGRVVVSNPDYFNGDLSGQGVTNVIGVAAYENAFGYTLVRSSGTTDRFGFGPQLTPITQLVGFPFACQIARIQPNGEGRFNYVLGDGTVVPAFE